MAKYFNETGEVVLTLIDLGVDVEWRIPGFLDLKEGDGECYSSPDFKFDGREWYFCIYPNGSGWYNTFGHLDVEIKGGSEASLVSVEVCVSLGKGTDTRSPKKLLDKLDYDHTFERIVPRCEVERWFRLHPDAVLTVECTFKKLTLVKGLGAVSIPQNPSFGALQTSSASPPNLGTNRGGSSGEECLHCREVFDAATSHQKYCPQRPVTCPGCLEVTVLEKWLDDHLCKRDRTEGPDNKIFEDFKELFLNQDECDVTMNVQGKEFKAHKAILIARSPVFAAAYKHDMKEKAGDPFEIEDCDPSSFSDFLCYLYCGRVENLSAENAFSLFATADKYDVQDLKAKCLEFIRNNLSVDTFCETITLALQYSEKELLQLATEFFPKHFQEIIVTVKWQSFVVENPIQCNEIMVKSFVTNKN